MDVFVDEIFVVVVKRQGVIDLRERQVRELLHELFGRDALAQNVIDDGANRKFCPLDDRAPAAEISPGDDVWVLGTFSRFCHIGPLFG